MNTWDDLRGKRVAVWGVGREGQATVRKLADVRAAETILVEDNPSADSVRPTASGVLTTVDAVIKSPGISRYRPEVAEIAARGIPVLGGLGLWLAGADRARVVCVTGTKGKSTTTAILAHLLNGLGYHASTGGNIGEVPWDPVSGAADYYVIEVSSYQATDLDCAPPVVAVTSLHPDHLDWHGGVERYYSDKLSLCTRPGADLTVANGDSDLLRARREMLGPRVDWVSAGEAAPWTDALGIPGEHNKRNALIASRCITGLGIGATDADLEKAAHRYHGLPSRLATIGIRDGVTFVDDSLSTNVLPTLAALDAFAGKRIALIAGGHDRGIDYTPLAHAVATRGYPTRVYTLPGSGDRIHAALREQGQHAVQCDDLDTAVRQAHEWAQPDGVVLLSPASPSFGQFRDYRDRAQAFATAMRALPDLPRS
ncbi:MAG TPA: UDP-N-acetylmuramoyl-L-alanine--D-glutamate ligase [Streptosporangiaceae bacterium]|nr:UDP-N-acetylmuramoyl-L-alanine--D-glutamate ligase [Streptosporangiaceae bacterium]